MRFLIFVLTLVLGSIKANADDIDTLSVVIEEADWNGGTNIVVEIVPSIQGDVNGDGSLSVTDVGMMISYILQTNPEGFNRDAADMNGDGEITVTDVGALITKILTGE